MIQAYEQDGCGSDVASSSILTLLKSLPPPSPGESHEQQEERLEEEVRLLSAAIKWAVKNQEQKQAVRGFHDAFGWHVWSMSGWTRMGRASIHFCRGSDAERFALALTDCMSRGLPGEADLFLSRTVLQILAASPPPLVAAGSIKADKMELSPGALQQIGYAKSLIEAVRLKLSSSPLAPCLSSPLVHFSEMVLESLLLRSRKLFSLLKQRYSDSLKRDPLLGTLLILIDQLVLGGGGGAGALGIGGILEGLFKV